VSQAILVQGFIPFRISGRLIHLRTFFFFAHQYPLGYLLMALPVQGKADQQGGQHCGEDFSDRGTHSKAVEWVRLVVTPTVHYYLLHLNFLPLEG
jgi:hypothetical protein